MQTPPQITAIKNHTNKERTSKITIITKFPAQTRQLQTCITGRLNHIIKLHIDTRSATSLTLFQQTKHQNQGSIFLSQVTK